MNDDRKDFCSNQHHGLEDGKDHVYCLAHIHEGRLFECNYKTPEEALAQKYRCDYQHQIGAVASEPLNVGSAQIS